MTEVDDEEWVDLFEGYKVAEILDVAGSIDGFAFCEAGEFADWFEFKVEDVDVVGGFEFGEVLTGHPAVDSGGYAKVVFIF